MKKRIRDISNKLKITHLLKKSPTPTIIVECGFLSNPTEAQLLSNDSYQEKLARAIYIGIYNYIKRCS